MIYKMYVGGYSSEVGSIYEVHFNSVSNDLKIVSINDESLNPIHILNKDNILFSANEIEEVARVSSFRINDDGSLKLINRLDGEGNGTCDITVSDDVLYAANYGSGNIFSTVFEEDGTLSEIMSNINHSEDEPRAHSTILSKDKKYLYEANLGLDKIFIYEVYPEGIITVSKTMEFIELEHFEGPRHMSISGDGKYLYIISEYGNTVYSYEIDKSNGNLSFIEKLLLVDEVESYGADIHFSKDDKFLYASLRGPDLITQISLDKGHMEVVDMFDSGGSWPRSFKISDDNEYMFVANQKSNSLTVLKIDQNEGSLSKVISEIEIFRPTSIVIY